MPSNVENILNGILTGDGSGIQKPASRVEELLYAIYQNGGGGGGVLCSLRTIQTPARTATL